MANFEFDTEGAKAAGYSDEEIEQFLRQQQGASVSSGGLGRKAAIAASEFAEGAASTLGLPGDAQRLFLDNVFDPGINLIRKEIGLQPRSVESGRSTHPLLLPTSNDVVGLTDSLGLTNRKDLAPQNVGEERVQAMARGAGGAIPLALLGMGPLSLLASGGAAGAGGQAAHELLPGSSAAEFVGSLAGGIGAQGLEHLLAGNQIKGIANALGRARTPQEAGEDLQNSVRDWIGNVYPARWQQIWAPLNSVISGTRTSVPLSNFTSTLNRISTEGGSLQPLLDDLRSNLPDRLAHSLQNTTSVGLGFDPVWNEVVALRRTLGDAMALPKIVESVGQKQLDALYASLSEDMREGARAIPDAEELFEAANNQSTALVNFANGTAHKIAKSARSTATDPLPEDVAANLLSKGKRGGTALTALRNEFPVAVDNLAAAFLRQPKADWLALSPEAKRALVPAGNARQTLDRLFKSRTSYDQKDLSLMMQGSIAGAIGGGVADSFIEGTATAKALAALGFVTPYGIGAINAVANNPNLLKGPAIGGVSGHALLQTSPEQ